MTIFLGNINADPLLLDKRELFNAANPVTVSAQCYEPFEIDTPTLVLSIDYATGYNYAYIPTFGQYYFLGAATVLDGSRCAIPAAVDVLTTNADSIKQLNVTVRRYETNVTPFVPDGGVTQKSRTYTENYYFDANPFTLGNSFGTTKNFLLSVVGGDGTGGNNT